MSNYQYAGSLFNTAHEASVAAVGEFMTAGGLNSLKEVTEMTVEGTLDEMDIMGFVVPYMGEHSSSVESIIEEVIEWARRTEQEESES